MAVFDHLGLSVSDYAQSKAFYEKVLAPLGITVMTEGEGWCLVGRMGEGYLWLGRYGTLTAPISRDRRPYSIFGQRFMITVMPSASARAAAASLRTPSCIQMTRGLDDKASASSTTPPAASELRKISTMSIGLGISASVS